MKILLVGLNHRTAPLEVRERFAVDDPRPWLDKLVATDEIEEAVLLSTCNRVEVLVTTRSADSARHRLHGFFQRELSRGEASPGRYSLYEFADREAVSHLFRVASSLDSMVVGEPQILGQVKEAYRVAAEVGAAGPVLNRLLPTAFAAAKRVRSETEIGMRPVSVARVAVDLARQIFESLEDKSALLVGAGEMIVVALQSRRGAGLAGVRVANRTPSHAAALAARSGASAHGLDELPELVAGADVVLASIASARPLLGVELFSDALHARRRRPIFVIDLGVPRNVDPEVNRLDGVYLYDVDDLGGVAEANAEERRRETARAEALVQEEVQRFDGWLSALRAVPTIRQLRARAEWLRREEVERASRRLVLSEEQRQGVEALTRALVNKLLHAPMSHLRSQAEQEEGIAQLQAARELFALDDTAAPGAEADGEPPEESEPE